MGVRDVARPGSDLVHTDAVLGLCLPASADGAQQKARVRILLSADITLEEFYLRVPGFPGNGFSVTEWAAETAGHLLPVAIPEFPRHRWVNHLQPLSSWAFVFVHNL